MPLGELRTDSAGRLIFLGGHGVSASPEGLPPYDPADPGQLQQRQRLVRRHVGRAGRRARVDRRAGGPRRRRLGRHRAAQLRPRRAELADDVRHAGRRRDRRRLDSGAGDHLLHPRRAAPVGADDPPAMGQTRASPRCSAPAGRSTSPIPRCSASWPPAPTRKDRGRSLGRASPQHPERLPALPSPGQRAAPVAVHLRRRLRRRVVRPIAEHHAGAAVDPAAPPSTLGRRAVRGGLGSDRDAARLDRRRAAGRAAGHARPGGARLLSGRCLPPGLRDYLADAPPDALFQAVPHPPPPGRPDGARLRSDPRPGDRAGADRAAARPGAG